MMIVAHVILMIHVATATMMIVVIIVGMMTTAVEMMTAAVDMMTAAVDMMTAAMEMMTVAMGMMTVIVAMVVVAAVIEMGVGVVMIVMIVGAMTNVLKDAVMEVDMMSAVLLGMLTLLVRFIKSMVIQPVIAGGGMRIKMIPITKIKTKVHILHHMVWTQTGTPILELQIIPLEN
jgi:hypothetical protein